MGYYSEESLRNLRRMATEEISRVLRGYWPTKLVNKAVRERLGRDSYKEQGQGSVMHARRQGAQ